MVFITKVESFLPGENISNDKVEDVLGLANGEPSKAKKIVLRSNGIKGRHYVVSDKENPPLTNAQLTAKAIQRLIKNTDYEKQGIELLACGTTCADQLLPSHASMVQGELKLNAHEIASTTGVCCSAISAFKYGFLSVKSGDKQSAVVTGSEISSKFMKASNFETDNDDQLKKSEVFQFEQDFLRWMLSDGAGAFLLENKPRPNQLNLKVEWVDYLSYANEVPTCMYGGALANEDKTITSWLDYSRQELVDKKVLNISQDVKLLDECIAKYCVELPFTDIKKKRGLQPGDIDWFIPHYSSNYFRKRVFDTMMKIDFPIPYEKWFTTIESKGNVGSASFYIYLHDLMKTGQLKAGQKILGFIPESSRFSAAYTLMTVVDG